MKVSTRILGTFYLKVYLIGIVSEDGSHVGKNFIVVGQPNSKLSDYLKGASDILKPNKLIHIKHKVDDKSYTFLH